MAYAGGTAVKHGFYWSMQAWDMAMIPAEGGTLPGSTDRHYSHIPTFLFLLMAPFMGALYVVFLPFIGFALVFTYAAKGLKTMVADGFMNVAASVAPQWAPAGAYLANRKREREEQAGKRAAAKHSSKH
jgi:hypothetical protein